MRWESLRSLRKISSERFVLIFSIVVLSAIILLNYESLKVQITGWASNSDMGVNVEPLVKGIITKVIMKSTLLEVGEKQTLFVEFLNLGSVGLDIKEEHHYHIYYDGKLNLVASYYDNMKYLVPGSKLRYNTTFVAPGAGLYYVHIRIPYETKVAHRWEAFYVYSTIPPGTSPPPGAVTGPPAPAPLGTAGASVTWPDNITIMQGESESFEVTVRNTGERELNNLKFFMSIPEMLNISISPKVIRGLGLNSSTIFLITVGAPADVELGTYPIELQFMTDELKLTKTINARVVPSNITDMGHLLDLIQNYEYLIDKVESEIYAVSLEGYDITLANQSLEKAKVHMGLAKEYFGLQEYGDTLAHLKEVIGYLEDALFQLASSRLFLYRPPAYAPFLTILLEVFLAILIFLIFYLHKKKERKPKALKKGSEA